MALTQHMSAHNYPCSDFSFEFWIIVAHRIERVRRRVSDRERENFISQMNQNIDIFWYQKLISMNQFNQSRLYRENCVREWDREMSSFQLTSENEMHRDLTLAMKNTQTDRQTEVHLMSFVIELLHIKVIRWFRMLIDAVIFRHQKFSRFYVHWTSDNQIHVSALMITKFFVFYNFPRLILS